MERQRIFVKRESIDVTGIDGMSLDEVVKHFEEIRDSYKGQDAVINAEYYGYDNGCDWYVQIYRFETDEEIAKREEAVRNKAEKARLKREAQKEKERQRLALVETEEREEYERLKAKFENKGV